MNQQQRKYAKERLEQICLGKISEITRKNTKKAVTLSGRERIQALKAGEFKVVPGFNVFKSYTRFEEVVIFNKEKRQVMDSVKIRKMEKLVYDHRRKTLDELMLGDCEKALSLIADFEKLKV